MSAIDYATFNTLKERMKAKFPVLLEGYLRDAGGYLETIRSNIPGGDLKTIIGEAHSFKSASGLLGLSGVHKAAEALEYAGKDLQERGAVSYEKLVPHYEALKTAFTEVEGEIRSEL